MGVNFGETGLEGTLAVAVYDESDNPLIARSTTGVTEFPAGSGLYRATKSWDESWQNARIVWDDTETFTQEVVTPTPLESVDGYRVQQILQAWMSVHIYANQVSDNGDGTRSFLFRNKDNDGTLIDLDHRPADGLRTNVTISL